MTDARTRVRKFTINDPDTWQQVGDGQQIFVADMVDESTAPDANMTVGFARVAKGETLDHTFPYDEVLILTKGTYSLRTEHGETLTARVGDFIYLPADSSNVSHADEDTEMVYVANPPDTYAQHVAQSAAGLA
jgi:ethanolamine utilization protein EutQ (cupin superfamily)